MRPTTAPARDLAEAKARVLQLLQEALDAGWKDDHADEGSYVWRTAEAAVLGEIAALLGASQEEIDAQNRHTLCPSHHAHACDFCAFACAHCHGSYADWKKNGGLTP